VFTIKGATSFSCEGKVNLVLQKRKKGVQKINACGMALKPWTMVVTT
jgi:hypothetical protein